MVVTLTFPNSVEAHTKQSAIDRIQGLTLVGDKLMDGEQQLIGISDEAVALYAGRRVEGKSKKQARLEAEELINSGLSLFEMKFKKGEIKTTQLPKVQRDAIQNKIDTLGAQ